MRRWACAVSMTILHRLPHERQEAGRHAIADRRCAVAEFILYTREYQAFCRRAFGDYLRHTLAAVMDGRGKTDNDGLRRVWWFSCVYESIDPKFPTRLPLIFALDAKLDVPDGFRCVTDCEEPGRARRAGRILCFRHLPHLPGEGRQEHHRLQRKWFRRLWWRRRRWRWWRVRWQRVRWRMRRQLIESARQLGYDAGIWIAILEGTGLNRDIEKHLRHRRHRAPACLASRPPWNWRGAGSGSPLLIVGAAGIRLRRRRALRARSALPMIIRFMSGLALRRLPAGGRWSARAGQAHPAFDRADRSGARSRNSIHLPIMCARPGSRSRRWIRRPRAPLSGDAPSPPMNGRCSMPRPAR